MKLESPFLGKSSVKILSPVVPNTLAPRQVTCMAKKKGIRVVVTLECTEARALGKPPSRYTTQKVLNINLIIKSHFTFRVGEIHLIDLN